MWRPAPEIWHPYYSGGYRDIPSLFLQSSDDSRYSWPVAASLQYLPHGHMASFSLLNLSLPYSYKDACHWTHSNPTNPGWSPHLRTLNYICKDLFPNEIPFTGFRDEHMNISFLGEGHHSTHCNPMYLGRERMKHRCIIILGKNNYHQLDLCKPWRPIIEWDIYL